MRAKIVIGISLVAGLFCTPVRSDGNIYFKVTDQKLVDYCSIENTNSNCTAKTFYEVKDKCAAPFEAAAVSCALDNFDYQPALLSNKIDAKTASCVYTFAGAHPDPVPSGVSMTLLCVKSMARQ